jgi:hypothetical protein
MNRLILIGNGFDLAHGLKTGYNDFILWYLKSCFSIADDTKEYDDEIINIKRLNRQDEAIKLGEHTYTIPDYIEFFYDRGFDELIHNKNIKVKGWQNIYDPFFNVTIKSELFRNLIMNCSRSLWVDIENFFYDHLKLILEGAKSNKKEELLLILNSSLKNIILKLEEYLASIKPTHLDNGYSAIFNSNIQANEIVTVNLTEDLPPEESLLLNFNYTSTAEHYFKQGPYNPHPRPIRVNYIHGKIATPSNPLIFGFGDELDESYLKMELERSKGFFEYIKSFWYFKTSNYHNLIRFIDAKPFQVLILGHSCGLSDRTMLNMIFEHEQCKSIKIYYYGEKDGPNNFKTLTEEISRHFKNKSQMRKKIVPFDLSQPMPQVALPPAYILENFY